MKFTFEPCSLQQQFEILKGKWLIFWRYTQHDVVDKLSNISYFHLQRYFHHFLVKNEWTYIFKEWFSWEELMTIYIQDKKDQHKLLWQLSKIEISLISRIIAHTCPDLWSHRIYDKTKYNKKTLFYNRIEEFILHIAYHKKKHKSISLYFEKWYTDPPYPPVWNVMEILSLGQISKLYISLPKSYQKKIAHTYGLPAPVLRNRLEWLTQLRNICAHNDVLYGFTWLKQLTNYTSIDMTDRKNDLTDYKKIIEYLTNLIR